MMVGFERFIPSNFVLRLFVVSNNYHTSKIFNLYNLLNY